MRRPDSAASMALEVLHGALVLLGRRPCLEGAEIAAPAGVRVRLARIEAIAARLELADHGLARPRPEGWRRACARGDMPRHAACALRTLRFAARLCAAPAIANLFQWLLLSTAASGRRFHVPRRRRGARKGAGAGNAMPADVTTTMRKGAPPMSRHAAGIGAKKSVSWGFLRERCRGSQL